MKKMRWIICWVLLIGVLFGTGIFTAVCLSANGRWEAKKSDCIIVLGAKVRPDGSMSRSLQYRCDRALEAWEDGIAQNIIVCGGKGADEPAAEGEVMRNWFVQQGVPAEHVLAETSSTDTVENLRFAKELMEEHGWKTAAIATSDYHLRRALWIARDEGIDACGLAARSPSDPAAWINARMRESVSWTLYALRRFLH